MSFIRRAGQGARVYRTPFSMYSRTARVGGRPDVGSGLRAGRRCKVDWIGERAGVARRRPNGGAPGPGTCRTSERQSRPDVRAAEPSRRQSDGISSRRQSDSTVGTSEQQYHPDVRATEPSRRQSNRTVQTSEQQNRPDVRATEPSRRQSGRILHRYVRAAVPSRGAPQRPCAGSGRSAAAAGGRPRCDSTADEEL